MKQTFYVGTHGEIDPDLIKRVIITANNWGLSGKPVRKITTNQSKNSGSVGQERIEIDIET